MPARVARIAVNRTTLWLGFYGLVLLSWYWLYAMARLGGDWICGPDTVALLPMGGFAVYLLMWSVMMAAMMLPTIIPTLRAYDDLPTGAGATSAGWLGLVIGYGMVWGIGAAIFAGLQTLAINSGWLDITGVVGSAWLASALLILAGAYQFTRTKEACQDACLTPMQYFMGYWRPGFAGGVRMGLGIGGYCVGCCWAIMSLAFVGGVMSLLWMGLATAFMVAEKLPDIGQHIRLPAGIALIGLGLFVALGALGWT